MLQPTGAINCVPRVKARHCEESGGSISS